MTDNTAQLLHGLLSAIVHLTELPHSGQAGRVLLGAAIAGQGCSDGAIARTASMPVALVREVMPSMLERCLHCPPLLLAKANQTPAGVLYTGVRLTGEAERCLATLRRYLARD